MPRLTRDSIRVKWQFGRFSFNLLYRFASGFTAIFILRFLFDLLGGDVDDRAGVGPVQAFDLFELAHDLVLGHAVDGAVPNFLAVDVDGAQGLAPAVFGLDGRAIRPSCQGLVADDLQVPHVPLERGGVFLSQLPAALLDGGHDVRALVRVGQLARAVFGPDLAVACADGGLFQGDVAVPGYELLHELPLLRGQHPGLVGLDRGGQPGLNPLINPAQALACQELLVFRGHQAILHSRQPSPYLRTVKRTPGCLLAYM